MLKEEAVEFERHCEGCPQCAAILAQELFVTAMIRAARRGMGNIPKK
jgi:hypothetical protein